MRRFLRVVVVAVAAMAASLVMAAAASADTLWATCSWGGQSQTCDSTFWYPSEVTVVWTASPPPTSTSGCQLGIAYSYDTDTLKSLTCSATWPGPTTIMQQYTLHVETSSPTVSFSPSRPAGAAGWYDGPVSYSPIGAAFSGIASCTPPLTYAGPDSSNASLSGSCTDNAGKTAATSVSFKYDATPPTITGATLSRPPDHNGWYTHPVAITFRGTDDVSGISSCQTVTYSGPASGSVTGGCWDKAGNYASISVPVAYVQHVSTAARASIASMKPLLLQWKAKHGASYYNVQIFRGGRKVLSTWPSATSLFLSKSWRFAGHRFRLKAGRYRWYVWPGYGSRDADRYGRMLVSAKFTVG